MSRLLVHVGPTLQPDEIRRIAPEAEIQPPVEGGMLGQAKPRAGDVIVLIDGYYRDRPAVRHKEILHVMDQGVTVVGAASMGALRAAELADHGMVGVGQIFQMYRNGEICGDDEVAIKHRTAEQGYRPDSIALVNLRFGAGRGVEADAVSPHTAAVVLAAAKEMVFDDRTWPHIGAAVAGQLPAAGLAELPALREYCSGRPGDLKAQDAVLAVERGRQLAGRHPDGRRSPAASRAPDAPQPPWRTSYLREWVNYWDSVELTESGDRLTDADVLEVARLYWPGYPDLHQQVLSGLLAEAAARQLGQPSVARFALEQLGLTAGRPVPERLAKRLSAAERELPTAEQAVLLVIRTWPTNLCRDWRPGAIAELKRRPEWGQWRDIVLRADRVRNGSTSQVRDSVAGLLFLHRWGGSGPAVPRELGRRGFLTLTGLDQSASRYAALELASRVGSRAGR
jgi:hypothetical protein